MQLVAYGAQDIYLTGSPQITFFKIVYRRHTNYAQESIEQTFNGQPGFGKKASCTISRNGDLVSHVFIEFTAPMISQPRKVKTAAFGETGSVFDDFDPKEGYAKYVNSFGHQLLESVEIEIGGQRIDRHYDAYFEINDELRRAEEKKVGYGKMIGKRYDASGKPIDDFSTPSTGLDDNSGVYSRPTFYIPLIFFFNNPASPGLALPLIALQYHEVKLQVSFRKFDDLVMWGTDLDATSPKTPKLQTALTPAAVDTYGFVDAAGAHTGSSKPTPLGDAEVCSLYCDYIYLDTDDRRRFARVSHEYLIEQLQFTGVESVSVPAGSTKSEKVRLNFNHPCKELIFFCNSESSRAMNKYFDFGEGVTNESVTGYEYIKDAKLLLNGHDRFSTRPGSYFRKVQPFMCHTRVPARHIYAHSSSLRPQEYQPSGSCNMSRIDHAALHLTLNPSLTVDESAAATSETLCLPIYANNYNILRVLSGMGGRAYSN